MHGDNSNNPFSFEVAVFDLDLTLWDGTGLYEDVIDILNTLKSHDIKLYVASFHLEARVCCRMLGIADYFEEIYYGRDRTKADMIRNIMSRHPTVVNEKIAFFDDNFDNILTVKTTNNVKTIYINKTGLTWYDLPRHFKPLVEQEKYNFCTLYDNFDYYLE